MIVLTSDHGDYMGDHWLGEDWLHDEVVRVLMIVVTTKTLDRPQMSRGTVSSGIGGGDRLGTDVRRRDG